MFVCGGRNGTAPVFVVALALTHPAAIVMVVVICCHRRLTMMGVLLLLSSSILTLQ
jgi:hypothetical protein